MRIEQHKQGIISVMLLAGITTLVIVSAPVTMANDEEPLNNYVSAETKMCTPTPTIKPTNTPTPTVTPTPFPDSLFEEEPTPQAIYEEAVAQGKVNPPRKKHITRTSGVCNLSLIHI